MTKKFRTWYDYASYEESFFYWELQRAIALGSSFTHLRRSKRRNNEHPEAQTEELGFRPVIA